MVVSGGAMSKKFLPVAARHVIWLSWKLVVFLSVALCLLALLRLHSSSSSALRPSISRQRSRISRDNLPFSGPPRIAFLFLSRLNLPLDFLWESFLENADEATFSIYVHSAPGFVFDESTTRSRFFQGRQLRNSIQVGWGESTMIQAERLLLEAALEDPANQRFVLLSDSCVPLYNFSYIYNYVIASPRSFVDSFLDAKEGRYNPKMSPKIPMNKWRKGSQWIALIRRHAEVIVDDEVVFPLFQKFCVRRPPLDARKGKLNIAPAYVLFLTYAQNISLSSVVFLEKIMPKLQKQHNCIPDEHYVQTLLAMNELESELERRTLTYTLWNQSVNKMENRGWHPVTFSYANAGPQKIKEIKAINHVYYETEYRTEWCQSNSTSVPCFLFARKFSQGAAMRLLSEGVVGHFDTSALLEPRP
ncbi:hypothetical protein TIFTF001_005972 [Ficus carica]|uniref:Core-2/I-branching beta-1,6-N-acetylglucosaminyltransferase family protein n=1 Tax=Ficus carica TaxID=3494 RepID=A0AA87ZLV5_FICCA|nr:hypothetical protein TIFTF001_005972 [Ficus carica]